MSIRLIRTFYLALLTITMSAGSAWAAVDLTDETHSGQERSPKAWTHLIGT